MPFSLAPKVFLLSILSFQSFPNSLRKSVKDFRKSTETTFPPKLLFLTRNLSPNFRSVFLFGREFFLNIFKLFCSISIEDMKRCYPVVPLVLLFPFLSPLVARKELFLPGIDIIGCVSLLLLLLLNVPSSSPNSPTPQFWVLLKQLSTQKQM